MLDNNHKVYSLVRLGNEHKISNSKKIKMCNLNQLKEWLNEGHFKEGTMKPKIEAAIYFLEHHGEKAVITSIKNISDAINEKAGTIIKKV